MSESTRKIVLGFLLLLFVISLPLTMGAGACEDPVDGVVRPNPAGDALGISDALCENLNNASNGDSQCGK